MDKSLEQQQRDQQAGREEGRRRAAAGVENPWSANQDYARGLEQGRREQEEDKNTQDLGTGFIGFAMLVILFCARALWHAVSNPAEALVHYGILQLLKEWIVDVFYFSDFVVIVAAVGIPIVAITTFNTTLFAIRRVEIEADYLVSRVHPILGWLLFYSLIGLTVAAGCLLVSLGRRGDAVPLIFIDVPLKYAYAVVIIVPTLLRLFNHPLSFKYNPMVGK